MIPILLTIGGIFNTIMVRDAYKNELRYCKSNSNAEQALTSIRVVKAFNQEDKETKIYNKHLTHSKASETQQALLKGFGIGLIETFLYLVAFINTLIGCTFVRQNVYNDNVDRDYRIGDVYGIYQSTIVYTIALGMSGSNYVFLTVGLKCCSSINSVVERTPKIQIDDLNAEPIESITEDIVFNNVTFSYITRNKLVLKDVNLTFERGKVTALVGISGSGKSTIAKLLERFYDPDSGMIKVNGKDLKTLNLREYRKKIGYVGQEPFLFNNTIKENLRISKPDATDEEINQALKDAMAYDFVQKFPQGINSEAGEIGHKISGGQKQRIAIARALLRKPEILIFDEATSALDKKNERKIQRAIERISSEQRITTIVIAHRLSTIQNANMIYVFEKGKVVENGNHEKLMSLKDQYYSFYKAQGDANKYVETSSKEKKFEVYSDEASEENKSEIDEMLDKNIDINNEHAINDSKELSYIDILKKLYKYHRPRAYLFACAVGVILVGTGKALIPVPQVK